MVRHRSIRDEVALPDDTVLVRLLREPLPSGEVFDREDLIVDVGNNYELFGYYGLSLWATVDGWLLERVLTEKAARAMTVALFRAGDLRDKGLGLVPSGRSPHYDTNVGDVDGQPFGAVQVTAPTAADLVARFVSATYTVMENPHYNQRS